MFEFIYRYQLARMYKQIKRLEKKRSNIETIVEGKINELFEKNIKTL